MKVLVVGNTGPVGLGRAICQRLAKNTKPPCEIYALFRESAKQNPEKTEYFQQLDAAGVNYVEGDLKNVGDMLAACENMDVVITTATITSSRLESDTVQTVDLEGQTNLLNAAKQQGVKHFIYTSYSKNTQEFSPCALTAAKLVMEKQVMESGLRYTILRPSYFTECWLSPRFGFDIQARTARFFGDGKMPVSYITTGNVADFAVASITNENAHNQILELGGPDAIAPLEMVSLCQKHGSSEFTIDFVPMEALESQRENAVQEKDTLTESLTSLAIALAKGDSIPMEGTQEKFPEVQLESVENHILTLL